VQSEFVDLDDDAVDLVLDGVAVLTVIRDVLGRADRAVVHLRKWLLMGSPQRSSRP
jgi:hypothetical protein